MDGTNTAFPVTRVLNRIRELTGQVLAEEEKPNSETSPYKIGASIIVSPHDENQLSQLLQLANADGYQVVPQGGGTKDSMGGHTGKADILLSTRNMAGILHHSVGDLMVTALPGTTVEQLQETLRREGQFLPIDPAWSAQSTIGGMVAANASGPKRALYGSARDHLIAARVVLADGTVIRTGAKVVKNVAGYDMNKLFVGSMGTIGVLSELTFKIRPLPVATGLLVFQTTNGENWRAIQEALLDSQLEPCAAELVSSEIAEALFGSAEPAIVVLFEDVEPSVHYQTEWLKSCAAGLGLRPVLQGAGREETEPLMEHLRSITPSSNDVTPNELIVSLKLLSSIMEVAGIYEYAMERTRQSGFQLQFSGGLFTGISHAVVRTNWQRLQEVVDWILAMNAYMDSSQGAAIVTLAPTQVRAAVPVWGTSRADGGLMKGIKQQLDSALILNHGRYAGGI